MVAENVNIQEGLGKLMEEISIETILYKISPLAQETWTARGWKQILEKYP